MVLALQEIRAGDLCLPCLRVLPVTGAAVSSLSGPINTSTVCATDGVAAALDELQFDLGEGPCWEAFATRRPVLVPDLRADKQAGWPMFAVSAGATGARAVFAFPLFVGSTGVGALNLYRDASGDLSDSAVRNGVRLAATIAVELARRIVSPGAGGDPGEWRDGMSNRREIHQATGAVMEQLDLSVGAAFARIRAHAFATGTTMAQVAEDVLSKRLRLTDDGVER